MLMKSNQKKIKLFIDASPLYEARSSGIGHSLLSILKSWQADALSREKIDVTLLVSFDKKQQIRALKLGYDIKIIPLPNKVLRMLRHIDFLPPMDLLLGRGIYLFPNYWNLPLAHSRSLTYVYDVSFLVYPEYAETRNQRFLAGHLPVWLKRTDKVITVSNHAKAEIMKYYQVESSKIHVVYNGVNTKFYQATSSQDIAAIKNIYNIVGEYLLFVGNIEPRKNISRLVAAYKLLPANLSRTFSLVIVGANGWNNHQILEDIRIAQNEGFVVHKIEQYVPDIDLPALYAGAALLVHPALYEGFGMTPLEAMAAGTPVIVGDNSSLREVVGDAGLYVNAEDEKDISAKIRLLLENEQKREQLRQAGLTRVLAFTWKQTVAELVKTVENL